MNEINHIIEGKNRGCKKVGLVEGIEVRVTLIIAVRDSIDCVRRDRNNCPDCRKNDVD